LNLRQENRRKRWNSKQETILMTYLYAMVYMCGKTCTPNDLDAEDSDDNMRIAETPQQCLGRCRDAGFGKGCMVQSSDVPIWRFHGHCVADLRWMESAYEAAVLRNMMDKLWGTPGFFFSSTVNWEWHYTCQSWRSWFRSSLQGWRAYSRWLLVAPSGSRDHAWKTMWMVSILRWNPFRTVDPNGARLLAFETQPNDFSIHDKIAWQISSDEWYSMLVRIRNWTVSKSKASTIHTQQ
jgi:hypothetical protein